MTGDDPQELELSWNFRKLLAWLPICYRALKCLDFLVIAIDLQCDRGIVDPYVVTQNEYLPRAKTRRILDEFSSSGLSPFCRAELSLFAILADGVKRGSVRTTVQDVLLSHHCRFASPAAKRAGGIDKIPLSLRSLWALSPTSGVLVSSLVLKVRPETRGKTLACWVRLLNGTGLVIVGEVLAMAPDGGKQNQKDKIEHARGPS